MQSIYFSHITHIWHATFYNLKNYKDIYNTNVLIKCQILSDKNVVFDDADRIRTRVHTKWIEGDYDCLLFRSFYAFELS